MLEIVARLSATERDRYEAGPPDNILWRRDGDPSRTFSCGNNEQSREKQSGW